MFHKSEEKKSKHNEDVRYNGAPGSGALGNSAGGGGSVGANGTASNNNSNNNGAGNLHPALMQLQQQHGKQLLVGSGASPTSGGPERMLLVGGGGVGVAAVNGNNGNGNQTPTPTIVPGGGNNTTNGNTILTQAGLEEYSRAYYEQTAMYHHQKQSSYAQSEGYHSYVSSSDSSSTPFLDRGI
uniref:Uncharacterized protein n=1 Tax=Anopheles melas TaxID=34690 RepID=A0A182ULG9_9DIPT